jgi:hypothetical protein
LALPVVVRSRSPRSIAACYWQAGGSTRRRRAGQPDHQRGPVVGVKKQWGVGNSVMTYCYQLL